ncbi:MAG: hypothetical protein ACE5JL_04150 [Dehalococcoidia bacterium]
MMEFYLLAPLLVLVPAGILVVLILRRQALNAGHRIFASTLAAVAGWWLIIFNRLATPDPQVAITEDKQPWIRAWLWFVFGITLFAVTATTLVRFLCGE